MARLLGWLEVEGASGLVAVGTELTGGKREGLVQVDVAGFVREDDKGS